ncbi:hypothetical protein [Methylocucumis oryzae]|uniref:hypothetical protein n=1 Tax=Methylocucumis oryzae TaxID=1632867 RepID=UPI00178D04F7|nr:hypothetical protein [Methylocucumis oryzae]
MPSDIKRQLLDGVPVDALGFDDDDECAKGILHKFYSKMIQVSSGITTMSMLNRHQLLFSPDTYGAYFALGYIARDRGQVINKREKQLFALFFDIFIADFKQKLRCSEQSGLLPILALEAFKARELACIKTCFDLKQAGLPITRNHIVSALYFNNQPNPSAEALKKALDKVDYDFKKVKARVFNGLETTDDQSIQQLYADFSWSHVIELFKLFAFSGFYPDASGKYISNVQLKMGEWAPH